MATYIRTLTDYQSNKIYPQSTAEAIYRQGTTTGLTVEQSFFNIESQLGAFATIEQVNSAVNALFGNNVASSLSTLEDLATALGNDPNFSTTIMNLLDGKQNLLETGKQGESGYQCGTKYLASNGILDNTDTIPTTADVYSYVQNVLTSKISSILFDGVTYTGSSVELNTLPFLKTTDAGSAVDPIPINADTLNGYSYQNLVAQFSNSASASVDNVNYPIVAWDTTEHIFKYSTLVNINPSTGNINANKVYNAVYNDYAEWFEKDNYNDTFEPGEVCVWTGNGVLKSSQENDTTVVGVVSNTYGHILGGEKFQNMEDNKKKFVPIGLAGRVTVKVLGTVENGDILVAGPKGCAIVNNEAKPNMIIGKALETSYISSCKKIKMLIK